MLNPRLFSWNLFMFVLDSTLPDDVVVMSVTMIQNIIQ